MSDQLQGRRERKKQAVREKIYEETANLIELHGVEGTTIDAICDCTDIAKKTFYNYYPSKHELLLDICQSILLNRTSELIDSALASQQKLVGQLDLIFQAMQNNNDKAGRLERELIAYMVSNLAMNISQGAGQLTFMNDCFERLYKASEDELKPQFSPEFCAEITVGMVNALTLNWLHNDHYDVTAKYQTLAIYIQQSILRVA
jgi:AcrR family transcriptional regulator